MCRRKMSQSLLACLLLTLASVLPVQASTISPMAYEALTEVHELLQESQWLEAGERLDRMIQRFGREPYAQATAWQMRGYVFSELDQHDKALHAYEKALDTEALDTESSQQVLYNTAQLLLVLECSSEAVERIGKWLAEYADPTPTQQVQAAWIYLSAGNHRDAATLMQGAISRVDEPQQSWYQILVAALQATDDFRALEQWLPRAIKDYPEQKTFWMQLTSVHLQQERHRRATATLAAAYHNGLLEDSSDLTYMAQLFLHAGVPHKAARVLREAMHKGTVEDTARHYEMLAEIWLRSRETGLAIHTYEQALKAGADYDVSLRLGRLLLQNEEHHAALPHLKTAAKSDKGRTRAEALLLLGMAAYSHGAVEEAQHAFVEARAYEEVRRQAENWLEYLKHPG